MLFNLQALQESFNQNRIIEPKEEIKQVSTKLAYELKAMNLYKGFFLQDLFQTNYKHACISRANVVVVLLFF